MLGMIRKIDQFVREKSGVGAVEFAILVPVVLSILFAIIEFGSIMYTRQQMLYAAREAARSYSIGQSTSAEAKGIAFNRLEIDTSQVSESDIKFTVTITEPNDGVGDVKANIKVPMADAAIINPLGDLISGELDVNVVMLMERPPKVAN
tara:strand:+ start:117 stop:563 length:447 start_codon:yes stop_codon:yes gene_type:complete